MSKKYRVTRITGLSSNGTAIIHVYIPLRRVEVTPLPSTSRKTLYRSIGCELAKCPFPNMTCKGCQMNYIVKTKRI